jgi:hypothetical protein
VNFLYFSVFLENLYDTESMIVVCLLWVVARAHAGGQLTIQSSPGVHWSLDWSVIGHFI